MSDFTKKEKNSSMPSSPTGQEQLNYFQTIQVSPAHLSPYLTGNHEFWYCLRSKLLHNSSKTTGSNQMYGKWGNVMESP